MTQLLFFVSIVASYVYFNVGQIAFA